MRNKSQYHSPRRYLSSSVRFEEPDAETTVSASADQKNGSHTLFRLKASIVYSMVVVCGDLRLYKCEHRICWGSKC